MKARAIAAPIPCLAPLTSTTWPSNGRPGRPSTTIRAEVGSVANSSEYWAREDTRAVSIRREPSQELRRGLKEHVCVICPKSSAVAQIDSSGSQYRHDRGPAAPAVGTESKFVGCSEVVRAHHAALREWWQRFDVTGEPPCHIAIGNRLIDLRNHKHSWIPGDVTGN